MTEVLEKLDRAWVLTRKRVVQSVRRSEPRLHVFVAGMQRSGTNMLMDVLERSLETDVYHESDPRAFDNYLMRDEAVIRALAKRSPAPVFVVKALCELQRLQRLMNEFRPAKALWVLRRYDDVVNSMLRSFPPRQADRVLRIAEDGEPGWWLSEGISGETLATVRRLSHPEMSNATGAAIWWLIRNTLFFEHGLDRDPRVMLVPYERLVTHPQEAFPRVFDFLGIGYTPYVSAKVFASSIGKRRPPEIDPAVREVCDALYARFQTLLPA
jgi:hypothetical protein